MEQDNGLFREIALSRKILLPSNKLDVNYDQYVLDRIREMYEDKCTKEGYVDKNSIRIKDRSLGQSEKGPSTAALEFKVVFTARVCNPAPGTVLRCKVFANNKMGILARVHPLKVIILFIISDNKELFEQIKVGDEITIEVLERTFDLNDKEIRVVGKILTGDELANEKLKKIKNKSLKEEDSFTAGDDGFVESNITGDDEGGEGADDDILDAEDEDDEEEGPDDEEAEDEDDEQVDDDQTEDDEEDDEDDEQQEGGAMDYDDGDDDFGMEDGDF